MPSYIKRRGKSKKDRDFESRTSVILGTDGKTYDRLDEALEGNSAVYIFITVLTYNP